LASHFFDRSLSHSHVVSCIYFYFFLIFFSIIFVSVESSVAFTLLLKLYSEVDCSAVPLAGIWPVAGIGQILASGTALVDCDYY
jgi:hypothetical protein